MKTYYYILPVLLCLAVSCKHEPSVQPKDVVADNYPEAIRSIMLNKCATAGCHNAASYKAAGGLRLDSWEHLFEGGNNGTVIVPYNADNSSLLYFVNTNADLGTTAEPTMPYNSDALSKEEYLAIRDWVNNGAPDVNGNIPFASNPGGRQKIYTVQQGCDLVAVIDAQSNVVMRYIRVGVDYGTENPNHIVMSPDGDYAYVSFWNANLIQKIDTRTDSVIATVSTPRGFQKAIALNKDGSKLIACNWYTQDLILIDAATMQVEQNYGQDLRFLSGFAARAQGGFYAVSQFGNTLYKIDGNGTYSTISIDGLPPVQQTGLGTPDPFRIATSPDDSKYFITCTNTDELRILDAQTDQTIKTIKVGHNPQEIAVSKSQPYLFVSCMNDTLGALEVGSVYVINYNTLEVVKKITAKFFQPYGVSVDDRNGLLFVFSRNEDKNGPPPHHSSPCEGRNGFYQVFDINTLERATNKRFEVTVDPYSSTTRFR